MTRLVDIERLLPHRGRMVLINRVIAWTDQFIKCGAVSHLRSDNPLRRSGRLSALAGVEYAGQAIAIHTSLTSRQPLSKGALARLRDLEWKQACLSDFSFELVIDAQRQVGGHGGARYDFEICCEGHVVLKGGATVAFFD